MVSDTRGVALDSVEVDSRTAGILACLEAVCSSPHLAGSKKLVRFLRFVAGESLRGAGDGLNEYAIAVEVYERPESFDPRIDNIVRVEARRLRGKLDEYYRTAGARDEWTFSLPRGSYRVEFQRKSAASEPHDGRRLTRGAARWTIALLVLAVAVTGALMAYRSRGTTWAVSRTAPRLIVLPFDNLSAGPGDAGVALAIAESLTSKLARVPGIQVISRTSADAVKRQALPIREIRTRLKADYVLEGSFLRDRDGCRVSVQLIRTSDDSHLWSEQYDVPWSNILLVQEEVSTKVLLRVKGSATASDKDLLDRGGTRNAAALEEYWKGLEEQNEYLKTLDVAVFESCERRFRRALELDPGYVEAMAELGRLYARRLYPPRGPRAPWVIKAASMLERALSLDPGHVRANAILGSLYAQEGDTIRGVEYARRAVSRGMLDAEAMGQLAEAYCAGGFYEEALECARQGVKLDPISLFGNTNLEWHLAKLGRFAEAHEAAREYRESGGPALIARFLETDILLREGKPELVAAALASDSKGEGAASEEAVKETATGLAATMQGDVARGRQTLERYRSQGPRGMDWLVRISALVGEKDIAIDLIESSTFYRNYRWVVTEPSLRPFRGDARFQELVRRLHADWQRDLTALREGLRRPPPTLPTPDQYFTR